MEKSLYNVYKVSNLQKMTKDPISCAEACGMFIGLHDGNMPYIKQNQQYFLMKEGDNPDKFAISGGEDIVNAFLNGAPTLVEKDPNKRHLIYQISREGLKTVRLKSAVEDFAIGYFIGLVCSNTEPENKSFELASEKGDRILATGTKEKGSKAKIVWHTETWINLAE